MPPMLLLDEFHLAWLVPRGLPDHDVAVIRRTMYGSPFQRQLREAIERLRMHHPALQAVRIKISR